ncbi:MAG TPA: hypothetical protein DCG37_03335, partial [Lachnospiraceae bacterium]|nr:hypothetical protein [Lachnospiraceae bacterium]
MRKKNWATRMISGLLSAVMVVSAAVTPITALASEVTPEENLKAYVESLPELDQVKDLLDSEEIVTAKDYEVDFDAEIDLKKDFTNLEIPDKKKVNVKFYEAKDADKKDFAPNQAGTYRAVYYVEPVNEQHPSYRISRNITVKEPVTEAQTSAEGNEGSGDETSNEESEDTESDSDEESSPATETEISETVVSETVEVETAETVVPETTMTKEPVRETPETEETEQEETETPAETAGTEAPEITEETETPEEETVQSEEAEAEAAETETAISETRESETSVDETPEVEPETELTPATMPESVEETTESISEPMAYPADIREVDVDGVIITVAAPEGAFPEGWTVKAKRISQKKSEGITEAIDEKFNGNVNKAASYTFDITILNAEGDEIQPENGKKVQVSFAMKEVESAGNLDVNVYHIEDGDQQIDKLKTNVDENTVTVTTDGFSWYTVEFTYNDLQYVMPGGQSIALSDILERVGLAGTVSDVSVSDSGLFYPYQDKNGVWFIQSVEAFHTKEWMKVTIDSIVYEITVTDATTFTPDYTTKATIERETWVGFGDVGDGSTARFHVEFTDSKGRSVKQDGYCVEPHWYAADGTYEKVGIKELKDSKKLAKVVYYGTESLSGDDCFFKQSGNTKYTANEQFGIVHWAAAKIYGSDEWSYCSNSTGKKASEALIDYAESMPSIPDAEISFSKESVTAMVPSGADYQKTPSITFKADTGNSITITLPKYVTYHDETNGKESAQSTGSTKVTIEAGTKFYFTAPLKYSGSMDDKWTVNAKGTYTKDLQAYLLDPGNERQPVAVVETFKGDRTASFTVEWLKTAKLTVVKTDAAGKRKLSGAVFGVFSDKACTELLVKMPATDVNGSSTVELETSGTVYLKELTPPKGYRISVTSEGVTVSAGETTTKTVPNEEIKGELKVYKQGQVLTGAASDANGTTFKYETAKLAGATYSVTAGADITDAAGTVVYKKGAAVATLKTNANGEATLSNLPLGTYAITETSAPVNHVNKGESKTVTLKEGSTSAEAVVGTATFNNDRQKVEVNALKQDKLTQTPVGGAVYGLYADAEIKNNAGTVIVKKDALIGKVTTGMDGKAKFTADLPLGNKFYVKELTAPKGYKLNGSDTYRFTTAYTNDKQVSISFSHTFENEEIRGKLTIFKEGEVLVGADVTDAGTTFKYEVRKQKGATFAVYAGAEIKSAGGKIIYKKGDLVKDGLVTGDDGSVSLDNLFLGTYTVKETGAPKNFVLNGESKDVTLSLANLSGEVVLGSVTIKNNRQKAKVTVVKKDDTTNNPLPGGIYGLYAGADIKAADGKVVVKKDTFIEKITTVSDGSAMFKADLPLNNSYYVKELQAPKNYFRNENDVYSFTFSYTNEKQAEVAFSHTFKNERVDARIDLIKVDAETGEPQGDAKLGKATYGLYARENIVHPDGKTGVLFKAGAQVATLTTDDDGKAYISDLYLGKYFIKELIPSEGYLLDEKEYDLDCAYEGDLVKTVKRTTTSKEQVIKQPFQVIKAANNGKTDADLLKGVGFSAYLISSLTVKTDGSYDFSKAKPIVLTEDGKTEMFTDEKGYAVSIPIPYGKYIVRETTTPHNYTPVDDFKVTISENHPKEPQQWRVLLD